jgi:GNAT superfamily N-acetyltransferase
MRTVISPTPLHFHDLAGHFLALSPHDRFLRFGSVMSDAWIVAYVESLLTSADAVFVVVESGRDISGVLHLESTGSGVVLGLSVSSWARRQGIGTLLIQRAGLLARRRGLETLFVRNLNLNAALQQLSLRLAMSVACAPTALTTSLEVPATSKREERRAGFTAKITLADDSLRPQWNAAPPNAWLPDLTEAIPS